MEEEWSTAGKETNLFDSLGVLPHPRRLRQHLLHRICRIAAICAGGGRAGWRPGRKDTGEPRRSAQSLNELITSSTIRRGS